MASNYWSSSQCKKWTWPKEKLDQHHQDQARKYEMDSVELRRIENYYLDRIQKVGQKLDLRQRVICSAFIYFKRFYLVLDYTQYSARLISTTCLYIASKAEECSMNLMVSKFVNAEKDEENDFSLQFTDILDAEWLVLRALEGYLVIYHPHRPLSLYVNDAGLTKSCKQIAWGLINDSYRTDLPLMFPPYLIALACVYIAASQSQMDLRIWFSQLSVDLKELWSAIALLLSLLEEKPSSPEEIRKTLSKLPKFGKRIEGSALSAQINKKIKTE